MSATILELNDSGLQVQADGRVLLDSPGFITVDKRQAWIGSDAQDRVKLMPTQTEYQYWDKLCVDPLDKPNALAGGHADLCYMQLADIWQRIGADTRDLIIAVPGDLDRQQLGLLLGMTRKLEMPVRALVDSGVAGSASPAPGRRLFHLDLHLHRTVLTELDQDAWLTRRDAYVTREVGLSRLRETWIHAIAGLFVQATRFDPMHNAVTEQALYAHLADWQEQLDEHEHVDVELSHAERNYSVRLHRRQILRAAEPVYRRLREFVADHLPGEKPATLQVTHRLAALPGLVQLLESIAGLDLVVLDALAARNGVQRLYLDRQATEGPNVAYVTRVPWFSASDLGSHQDLLNDYRREQATHVLHQAVAHPLSQEPFTVGTDINGELRGIALANRVPGVVGHHFRLHRDGQALNLEDLSGGHTLLNDEPVEGSVTVGVGDRIRIGSPGTEFLLIRVASDD